MSPVNLQVSTITDELRLATNMQSRVYGIALKDRGSILPAGHLANCAFWFDDSTGNFMTSTFYAKELPTWVSEFNAKRYADTFFNQTWKLSYPLNTYTLRVNMVRGQNVSITAAKAGRIAALEEAEANGGLEEFHITAETPDAFEGTYIDGGYLRVTMEQWVSFDGSHAYAEAAVTGRTADQEGLRDLLTRTIDSMEELPPKPKKGES